MRLIADHGSPLRLTVPYVCPRTPSVRSGPDKAYVDDGRVRRSARIRAVSSRAISGMAAGMAAVASLVSALVRTGSSVDMRIPLLVRWPISAGSPSRTWVIGPSAAAGASSLILAGTTSYPNLSMSSSSPVRDCLLTSVPSMSRGSGLKTMTLPSRSTAKPVGPSRLTGPQPRFSPGHLAHAELVSELRSKLADSGKSPASRPARPRLDASGWSALTGSTGTAVTDAKYISSTGM